MSLVPFVTEFLGKNYHQPMAVAIYAVDLSLCGAAFYLLRTELIRQHRGDTDLVEYHATIQRKNVFSALLYLSAAPLAYVSIYVSFFIFALIPALYFLPEKKLATSESKTSSI
jgi:uncharacterized membrane protein